MLAVVVWLCWGRVVTVPRTLEVCEADRAVLEARVAASTTPRRDWQRARVVLMAAEGLSSPVIGEAVGLNRDQVDVWRRRYGEVGLGGLAVAAALGPAACVWARGEAGFGQDDHDAAPRGGPARRAAAQGPHVDARGRPDHARGPRHRDLGLAGVADLHLDGPQAAYLTPPSNAKRPFSEGGLQEGDECVAESPTLKRGASMYSTNAPAAVSGAHPQTRSVHFPRGLLS